ncbi:MAG: bifunctional folylpolyglutamate synthase/dihydrofolate synthase [Chitinophagales bacterium]
MTYAETLAYLFSHLPMYQRIGAAAYKKDLTNTLKLCSLLNHPQEKFLSIHIGGTNGKGSVSNMLASVLYEAGYTTGLYTSPHLLDFRERIRVNGKMCEENFVISFTEKMQKHIEEIQPSFFEITVAMAFDYFVQTNTDIAVVEVGLGGRLDSTNVISPLLSIITNISYDHMNMLGNTLAEIATEKAGIIKHLRPCVIGEYHTETFPVFLEKTNIESAPLYLAEENVKLEIAEHDLEKVIVNAMYLDQLIYENLQVDLAGTYQLKNIKTVLQSIEILRQKEIEIPEESVYDGLRKVQHNTGFLGRLQILSKSPLILCDCAHNSAGLQALFEQLNKLSFSKLHIVTGMVNDKDPALNLKEFPQNAVYYFCKPNIPRGLDALVLSTQSSKFGLSGACYTSVSHALQSANQQAEKDDVILICGSIFVVANALETFQNQNQ